MNLESESGTSLSASALKILKDSSDLYFAPKPWERSGRMYESLGINVLRKLIFGNPLSKYVSKRFYVPNYFLAGHRLKNAVVFDRWTRVNESIHLCGLTTNILSLYHVAQGEELLTWVLLPCVLINSSRIMVQRLNRARIYRLVERANGNYIQKEVNLNSYAELL